MHTPPAPGEEGTLFYGWVTENDPERDRCRYGSANCLGAINFDIDDRDAMHFDSDTEAGIVFGRRVDDYAEFLSSIGQE